MVAATLPARDSFRSTAEVEFVAIMTLTGARVHERFVVLGDPMGTTTRRPARLERRRVISDVLKYTVTARLSGRLFPGLCRESVSLAEKAGGPFRLTVGSYGTVANLNAAKNQGSP